MSRVGSISGFYFFPLMLAALGLNATMLVLIAAPLTGLLACLIVRWEPIGQNLDAREAGRRRAGERSGGLIDPDAGADDR